MGIFNQASLADLSCQYSFLPSIKYCNKSARLPLPTLSSTHLTQRIILCLTTISAAVNFGASGFQTPITMPVLRNENVPAHHASTLVTHLLHVSEIVFPPLNAIGTVGNLAILGGVFANKSEITPEISAKIPYIATSFALSVAVTVYALTVMV